MRMVRITCPECSRHLMVAPSQKFLVPKHHVPDSHVDFMPRDKRVVRALVRPKCLLSGAEIEIDKVEKL